MGKDINELMNTLEKGVQGVFNSESYKEYLDFMGRFYDYSACNCMLILMQCPEASLVAGYNTWKKLNRQVKKGETAIKINEGMSETQTIKTLIHEIAHSILHKKDGEEKEADRRTREVQAESVAYMVSGLLGLDTAEYSFGYIAGWSGSQEVKELTASMEVIKKTVKKIIEGIERG